MLGRGTAATFGRAGHAEDSAEIWKRVWRAAAAMFGRARHVGWWTMVLLAPSALLLERAWDRRWTTDDGFINFRVVRMVLEGHGPVYNVGERVEATTSTLWLWVLVVGDILLPFKLEWVAVVLGLVCAVGGLAAATMGAARLQRSLGAGTRLVPLGALVLAVMPPMWEFSTSGLEGGLTFGWLGLTSFLLARWATKETSLGAGSAVVVGLGWLVRPDLVIVSVVVVVGVLIAQWRSDGARDRLRLLAAALALPVAYQIFRMGYYASIVPNTGLAKAGVGSRWSDGLDYLRDFAQPYWLVVPLVALVASVMVPALQRAHAANNRRAVAALVALPLAGLVHAGSIVRIGGDYMHARLLLPSFVALVLPLAVAPLPRLAWRRPASEESTAEGESEAGGGRLAPLGVTGGFVAAGLWAVVCLVMLRSHTVVPDLFTADAWEGHVARHGEHAVTARDQPAMHPPELVDGAVLVNGGAVLTTAPHPEMPMPAHVADAIGVVGYVYGTDVHIVDTLGLADSTVSRFELARRGLTGHEKQMPTAWLAARVTEGSVDVDAITPNIFTMPLYESSPDELDDDAMAARQALDCGDLRRLGEATTESLTPKRFVANLMAAPTFTRLSIPPDPHAAVERFCG